MRNALLLSLLLACAKPSPAPAPTNTAAPTPTAPAADDLAAIRAADRAVIRWMATGDTAERSGGDLAKLLDALVVSEQMPSGGKNVVDIAFYSGDKLINTVWVFHDGEWGLRGGRTRGLSPQLAQLIKK